MCVIGFEYCAEEYKCTELAGVSISDFYNDVELMVSVQRKAVKIISKALEIPPADLCFMRGHVKCAEYVGCDIYYPEDDEPFIKSPVLNDISDVKKLRIPDPPDNPVAQDLLTKTKRFFELTGIKSSIGIFEGPFTTAAFARGQTQFLLDWFDNIALCEKLLEKITTAIIDWKRYHDSEMGIKAEDISALVDDSITLISPNDFEKIVLPYLLKWFKEFPASQRYFHCCANITGHMNAISKLKLSRYAAMGEMMDIRKAKQAFPGVYISQLFDFRVLRDGNEKDIASYTNELLERSRPCNSYAVMVEGIRGVSLEKTRIVKDTIEKFNKAG